MKARHRRFLWIGAGVAVLGIAAALVLNAFQSNLVFFFTPTQVAEREAPPDEHHRSDRDAREPRRQGADPERR